MKYVKLSAVISILVLFTSCHSFYISRCGETDREDRMRLRSDRTRVRLKYSGAVARKFADYAMMSSFAYASKESCKDHDGDKAEYYDSLEKNLDAKDWVRVTQLEPECEDELGLFYNVWETTDNGTKKVAIAFRGTSELRIDPFYGYFFGINGAEKSQYGKLRNLMKSIKKHYSSASDVRYYSTGHSLGGGLAQYLLYLNPEDIAHSYVFNPSPVTGFTQVDRSLQIKSCECSQEEPNGARIYRIYESDEFLVYSRIFQKIFFAPTRHVFEIRLGFEERLNGGHGIDLLVKNLVAESQKDSGVAISSWMESNDKDCSSKFLENRQLSCSKEPTWCDSCR